MKTTIRLSILFVLCLAIAPLALAQASVTQDAAQEAPADDDALEESVPEVSDAQIEAFAEAYAALDRVRTKYERKLQETDDQDEARELQLEANEAYVEAIEESGMDPEEYQQVATAVNADPEVRARVTELLDEADDSP